MAIKIRLSKIGKRNAPAFRVVVAQERDKRNGKPLEVLGHFNPSHKPVLLNIDNDKYQEWVEKGAQPTKAVEELVEGKYEFQPYTRQNEAKKDGDEPKAEAAESEGEETAETAQQEEASAE